MSSCTNGCGFFGNPSLNGMCSKCFKGGLNPEKIAKQKEDESNLVEQVKKIEAIHKNNPLSVWLEIQLVGSDTEPLRVELSEEIALYSGYGQPLGVAEWGMGHPEGEHAMPSSGALFVFNKGMEKLPAAGYGQTTEIEVAFCASVGEFKDKIIVRKVSKENREGDAVGLSPPSLISQNAAVQVAFRQLDGFYQYYSFLNNHFGYVESVIVIVPYFLMYPSLAHESIVDSCRYNILAHKHLERQEFTDIKKEYYGL